MFQPHDIDPRLTVQILQFLWSIYSGRRARSKSGSDKKDGGPVPAEAAPDPDKLEELIKEVEIKRPNGGIDMAIDEKFSLADAMQVKEDFAAFAVLVSPPEFSDYDFSGLVQKYTEGMQTIALAADLFRLRGAMIGSGFRILEMHETSAALIPAGQRNSAVYTEGEIISASVAKCAVVLTEERVERPLVVVLEGVFNYASYGGYSGQRIERAEQAYRFGSGQESNWLAFEFAFKDSGKFYPFQPFEYRLNASDVKTIFAALKKDIISYLRDVEEERPVLQELRRELDGLPRISKAET